ncbi:MAG TPA: hypothetical protein VFO76_03165 [Candidatus Kapabacteria bacterium]|nr:hypothetical protein [Candidatus Kapabacteria bacterium]
MIRSQKKLSEAKVQQAELDGSEKLLVRYEQSASWVAENRQKVIGGAVILVAAVVGLFIWQSKRQEAADRAETLLARITPYYQSANWRQAIDGDPTNRIQNEPIAGLKQIVAEYGSTKAGQVASLSLGNAYYYLGKLDSALMAFDEISSDLPLVKASASAGKAAILEDKGNKEESAKLFMAAASVGTSNPLDADYSYAAARNLESSGKKDEAIKWYRKVVEEYSGTYYEDASKRALLRLGVQL